MLIMVNCDSIIENNAIFLENLCTNSSTSWKGGSSYGFYSIPYKRPLIREHVYYARCKYKYTTTNQSPTWCKIYMQGGMSQYSGAAISNPVAGTEYTISGYGLMTSGTGYPLKSGTVYNGPNNAISGVSASVKEMVIYDVTFLQIALQASGQIGKDYASLVTWCDNNLAYNAPGVLYDVTGLITDSNKVAMRSGMIQGDIVETDGMQAYSVSAKLRNNTYFDTDNSVTMYNNASNGTVTHTRVSAKDQNSPFYPEHEYVLEIKTNGEARPGTGGFVASHTAKANNVFIERFVAKVPVGYSITSAYNSQGTGAKVSYLTSRAGTGDWAEYAILYQCGSEGTFSSGGHVYLTASSGYSAQSVTWYLAYINNCNVTEDPSLAYYTALNNKDVLKGTKVFSREFNTSNIFPNGDGANTEMNLPTGWSWDTEDKAGNAKASIVQPVSASAGSNVGGKIAINPHSKYKISMWVKCKRDMTSFLVAINPYVNNTALNHTSVCYVEGTKTTLELDLQSGDTQMTVKSNANWKDRSYSRVGFRANQYSSCYNDKGVSNSNSSTGLISGVSGSNIVTFKIPYSGSTIPKGTFVVESYDGSNYPYPIQKAALPTDNTWKYVEGYFGAEEANWDGASNSSWKALPSGCTHISLTLNLYQNTGTVPIKYSDIRIEEVGKEDGERHFNNIQLKKYS